ncbi:MAG: ASKHA domain-containing protein [Candidatus Bathyarchaeota archaeon]
MGQLVIEPYGKKADLKKGKTLLSYFQDLGINIHAFCGGKGVCRGCLVKVAETKNLSAMTKAERESIKRVGYRLACQAEILSEDGDIFVEAPKYAKYKILEKGMFKEIPLNPLVKKKHAFPKELVCWRNDTIDEYDGELYGLALDIGTTTLSLYWVNLETGDTHFVSSMLNPQIRYGDNVIDRINYARTVSQSYLEKTIREAVNEMIQQGPINPNHIYEMVVVGNTVMRDLCIGHPVKSLGESPFKPLSEGAVNKPAYELEIEINSKANVYALPLIGHFVGADALAVILATEMYKNPSVTMAIDIGTNTEIAVGNKDRIIVTSCASGPAFEGSEIKCGTGAIEGAIKKVEISNDLTVKYETIDNMPPVGICGSGLIDALAQMLDKGIIHGDGKFSEGKSKFIIAENVNPVFLDGDDIDSLKLAKSATSAGIKIVMQHYGVDVKDLEKLYLAGAFGTFINSENAIKMGMLPDMPSDRIVRVGNAAIEGARQVLISNEKRKDAEEISKKIEHVRLEMEEDFQDQFMGELYFHKYAL